MTLEMYQQNILDHHKHPRNFGELPEADAKSHVVNPLCGDELDFFLKFDRENKVTAVKFTGCGCAISMASASMLSEKLQGMDRQGVEKFNQEKALQLLGVAVNPARLKCATLALEAVQQAIGHH